MALLTLPSRVAVVLAVCAWLCLLSIPTAAFSTSKELCSLDPVLHNATFPARRADGFRVCPDTFSAELVKVGDGTLYGACYKLGGTTEITKHRASECRRLCRKLGADLPTLKNSAVEAYVHTRFLDGLGGPHRFQRGFWLGATDHLAEGNWTWVDGGAAVEHPKWM